MTFELFVWPMALSLIGLGAVAMASPKNASKLFGIPSDSPWVVVAGVRDIALGLMLAIVVAHGPRVLIGEVCLATLVVPLTDSWLARKAGSTQASLLHIGSAFGIAILGAILIFTAW